jgi:uncharacterized protein with HEPN domain
VPDLEAFQQNSQIQDAVVRNIEIIGEAVNKINSRLNQLLNQLGSKALTARGAVSVASCRGSPENEHP